MAFIYNYGNALKILIEKQWTKISSRTLLCCTTLDSRFIVYHNIATNEYNFTE